LNEFFDGKKSYYENKAFDTHMMIFSDSDDLSLMFKNENSFVLMSILFFSNFSSARVGKTSLVARFLGGKFEESYTPTIEDFHRKLYRIRNEVYQLDILDTSGNHPFPAMRRLSFLTGKIITFM
jgi:hypothetical protein